VDVGGELAALSRAEAVSDDPAGKKSAELSTASY